MMTADDTPVLLPELEGELAHELTALEEWAIDLEQAAQEEELGIDAAAARAALAELWSTAAAAARQRPGRLLAPDGRREHQPMRTARVPRVRLEVLRAALAACHGALAPGGNAALAAALEEAAQRHAAALNPVGHAHEEAEAAAPLARLAALLHVLSPDDPDADVLRAALEEAARRGEDTVLSAEAETAHARLADRITLAWYGDDPLARWAMG